MGSYYMPPSDNHSCDRSSTPNLPKNRISRGSPKSPASTDRPDLTATEGVLEWADNMSHEWDGDYGTIDCGFEEGDTVTAATLARAMCVYEQVVKRKDVLKSIQDDDPNGLTELGKARLAYLSDILAAADAEPSSAMSPGDMPTRGKGTP